VHFRRLLFHLPLESDPPPLLKLVLPHEIKLENTDSKQDPVEAVTQQQASPPPTRAPESVTRVTLSAEEYRERRNEIRRMSRLKARQEAAERLAAGRATSPLQKPSKTGTDAADTPSPTVTPSRNTEPRVSAYSEDLAGLDPSLRDEMSKLEWERLKRETKREQERIRVLEERERRLEADHSRALSRVQQAAEQGASNTPSPETAVHQVTTTTIPLETGSYIGTRSSLRFRSPSK
jgi:hypothetical protein